jgi:dsDNA-specific endonuclease/ATPase MutS2
MESRSLRLLELSKVLEFLSGFAVSESGKARCRSLRPFGDAAEVRRLAAS